MWQERPSHRLLVRLIDDWRDPRGGRLVAALLVINLLLAAVTWLVHATGGTHNVFVHGMYVPILLAAFLFKVRGGLIAGVVGGLLLGPIMPLHTELAVAQSTSALLIRLLFFAGAGVLAGELAFLLNSRLDQLQESAARLAHTHARTLRTFATITAMRDEQTSNHCGRVAHNARIVGEALGLGSADLKDVYWAGMLHDLGKIAVPECVLHKPDSLTPHEYATVKRHPDAGAELVRAILPECDRIAEGVATHHERWDGSGYPRRLRGDGIPLIGRILAIVDAFEALTSDRPYRGPASTEAAVAIIRGDAGTHFDPALVETFEQLLLEGRIHAAGDAVLDLTYSGRRGTALESPAIRIAS